MRSFADFAPPLLCSGDTCKGRTPKSPASSTAPAAGGARSWPPPPSAGGAQRRRQPCSSAPSGWGSGPAGMATWLRSAALAVAALSALAAAGWAGWSLWRTAWGAPEVAVTVAGGDGSLRSALLSAVELEGRPRRARRPGALDRARRRAHPPHRGSGARDRPLARRARPSGAPGRPGARRRARGLGGRRPRPRARTWDAAGPASSPESPRRSGRRGPSPSPATWRSPTSTRPTPAARSARSRAATARSRRLAEPRCASRPDPTVP